MNGIGMINDLLYITTHDQIKELINMNPLSDHEFIINDLKSSSSLEIRNLDINVTDLNIILSKNFNICFIGCNIINNYEPDEEEDCLFKLDSEIKPIEDSLYKTSDILLQSNEYYFKECNFSSFDDIEFTVINNKFNPKLHFVKCKFDNELNFRSICSTKIAINNCTIDVLNLNYCLINILSINKCEIKEHIKIKSEINSLSIKNTICFIQPSIAIAHRLYLDENVKLYKPDTSSVNFSGGVLGKELQFDAIGFTEVLIENIYDEDVSYSAILELKIDKGSHVYIDNVTGECRTEKVTPIRVLDTDGLKIIELEDDDIIEPMSYNIDGENFELNKEYFTDTFSSSLSTYEEGVHFYFNKDLLTSKHYFNKDIL